MLIHVPYFDLFFRAYRLSFVHVTSPNATKNATKLDKNILQSKTDAVVWRKGARLQVWKWIIVHQI